MLAVQTTGEDPCRRGLAAASRTAEEICVVDPIVLQRLGERTGDVVLADDVAEPLGAVAAVQGLGHPGTLTVGPDRPRRPSAWGWAHHRALGREGTPRAPARACLPLLPSGPGGVRWGDAARGVEGESIQPPPHHPHVCPRSGLLIMGRKSARPRPAKQRHRPQSPPPGPRTTDRYPRGRRIRLVAYGARLESVLG